MFRASDFTVAAMAAFCWLRKMGRAMAARIPMITITIRSSMSVNPCSLLCGFFCRWVSIWVSGVGCG